MLKTFKRSAQHLARQVGLDVRRTDSLVSEHTRLALLLAVNKVDLVLDIGANAGQWARELRQAGYAGGGGRREALPAIPEVEGKPAGRKALALSAATIRGGFADPYL